jgi:hypothetical protein
MSNGTTSPLQGWRKILATLLMIFIPVINGSIVGINLDAPKNYETNTLVVWIVMALFQLIPAIATLIAGSKYISANTKQNIAVIETEGPKADSAAVVQPAASLSIPQAVIPPQPYKMVDLEGMINAAEAQIKKDGMVVDPMKRAFYAYPLVANFDLRPVPREFRVPQAIALVDTVMELFKEAFLWYTKLPKVPTFAQANNYHTYLLQLKKDFEKANNQVCSSQSFEQLRGILSYFDDLYKAQDGLKQLEGKTIDWSLYGAQCGPLQIGWDYAKLI